MTDAHRFIRVDLTHTGTSEDFHYIDIAREMSAMNSRLYRQGMKYHVANISVHDTQSSYLKFCTMPNTWAVSKAWKMAFRLWLEHNRKALEGTNPSTVVKAGKWNDFRIFMNNAHRGDTTDRPRFTDVEGGLIIQDEYNYTKMVSMDGGAMDEFDLMMMGEHQGVAGAYTAVCLLEALEETRTVPVAAYEEPDFATGVWANLFDYAGGNDDILDNLTDDYDAPPYSANVFPGSKDGSVNNSKAPWAAREVHIESANNSAMVGGFEVPCGLIVVETDNSANGNVIGLIIELAPGKYKGVKAEPMGTPRLTNAKKWSVR